MIRDLDTLTKMARTPGGVEPEERLVRAGGGVGGGGSLPLKAFAVKTIGDDVLTCREVDPTTGAEGTVDVYVLKPVPLRRSVWNGKTINSVAYSGTANSRTATGTVTETQIVTPAYVTGTWPTAGIWAVRLAPAVTADTKSCTYQEVCSSRDWASTI